MRPVVFIGPTLSRRRCSALLGAEYLPPARKGSLNEITPGRVVAIIDGEIPPDAFLPECEVRAALDRDVVLFGAASVGAYHASNFADLRYARGRLGLRSVPGRRALILRRNSGHVRSGFSARIVGSSRQCSILAGRTDSGVSSTTRGRQRHFGRATPAADIRPRWRGIKRCIAELFGRSALRKFDLPSDTFPDVKAHDAQMLLQFLARRSENSTHQSR